MVQPDGLKIRQFILCSENQFREGEINFHMTGCHSDHRKVSVVRIKQANVRETTLITFSLGQTHNCQKLVVVHKAGFHYTHFSYVM